MQMNIETIRLLILNSSRNEAEELVNVLRNAGLATQAQIIESSEHVTELIQSKSWDICFAAMNVEELSPFELLHQLHKLEQDIPVILITNEYDPNMLLKALNAGIRDTVPINQPALLQLVAVRELKNLSDRRSKRQAEILLKDAEKRCMLLLDNSQDAIAYLHEGMHIYTNKVYIELFGYKSFDDLECLPVMDLIASGDHVKFKQFLKEFKNKAINSHQLSYLAKRNDDFEFDVDISLSAAKYDGETCIQVIIRPKPIPLVDIKEQKQVVLKNHDAVTGLRNLVLFNEQIECAIKKATKTKTKYSVISIQFEKNIDFKIKADNESVKILLGKITQVLHEIFKPPHLLARVDANEFAVLVVNCDVDAAVKLAKTTYEALAHLEVANAGEKFNVTANLGVSILNENTVNSEEIIAKAREAVEFCITNKHSNHVHLHSVDEQYEVNTKKVTKLLKQALNNEQFKLVYQPVISLRGDSGEHYEVLLRMTDDDNEMSPSKFMQEASDSGLIRDIERWVIKTAMQMLTDHLSTGRKTHLFINLNAVSILDDTLLDWVKEQFKRLSLPNDSIIFQISEIDAVAHHDQVYKFIIAVAALKCKVSLTNFGRAINSFKTIQTLPIHYVRIDQSYISELSNDTSSKEELKTLISTLHSYGKLTIAPMVDTASLLPVLWQSGINYIQGYYIQQPSDAMDYDFSSDEED